MRGFVEKVGRSLTWLMKRRTPAADCNTRSICWDLLYHNAKRRFARTGSVCQDRFRTSRKQTEAKRRRRVHARTEQVVAPLARKARVTIMPCRKRLFFSTPFSLCLSRACLGKRIAFRIKCRPKGACFPHRQSQGRLTPSLRSEGFCEQRPFFPSTFPMFVPSLSW
eukprot:COSAG06_NODE_11790_length_1464_cov_1.509158_2_plen_166_part_00